eukprot:6467774-Amphidinium_carterae.1
MGLGVLLVKQIQKRLNPLRAYMLVKLLSNGVWTEQDKCKKGLQLTGVCKWCSMEDALCHHGCSGSLDELGTSPLGAGRLWPPARWFLPGPAGEGDSRPFKRTGGSRMCGFVHRWQWDVPEQPTASPGCLGS